MQPIHDPNRRTATPISAKLEKNLSAYIAAASAAGMGILATAQPAHAKVVYTPVNVTIAEDSQYLLDVNHDGVNDFSIVHFAYGNWNHLYAAGLAGDEIFGNGDASALRFGVPIGPKGHFSGFGLMTKNGVVSGVPFTSGKWNNVQTRYLGLKFSIDGATHYGWARVTVSTAITLTGYAYETIPNQRILAGEISGDDVVALSAPDLLDRGNREMASVGMLARGADTLAIWRREENTAPLVKSRIVKGPHSPLPRIL